MILNKLHDQCVKEKCTSKVMQITSLSITRAIQYESQNCQTKGTQCKINVQTRGIQCSLEKVDHCQYKSSGTQCELHQHVSKAIQCSFAGSNECYEQPVVNAWSDTEVRKPKCTVVTHSSLHELNLFEKECNASTLKDHIWCSKEPTEEGLKSNHNMLITTPESDSKSAFQQTRSRVLDEICESGQSFLAPSCSVKEIHRCVQMCRGTELMSQKRAVDDKNEEQELPFSGVEKKCSVKEKGHPWSAKKQRKGTCASSSTSGVAEMSDSRSGFSELNDEDATAVGPTKKTMKWKKKFLWTRSHDIASISVCDEPLDFSSLISKKQTYFPNLESKNTNALFSLLCRRKYTNDEQLLIIKYIAENNLYNQVGGVCIWQNMAAEAGINRTWQSLKEHFRKQILPNIKRYSLSSSVQKLFCNIKMK